MNTTDYTIIVEDAEGNFSAYCPDLPGVAATGQTVEECVSEMTEAIAFHIEGLRLDGEPVPPPTSQARTVHVSAA